tara:strand:+ start:365 stop:736 length:372 start_codon:yes stop_codon:yes gene_type:complete
MNYTHKDGQVYNPSGSPIGNKNRKGYVRVVIGGKDMLAHRWIWEQEKGPIPQGMTIDHINSNRSDNRIENLQLLTHKQNVARAHLGCAYLVDNKYWGATRNKKYLGLFGTKGGALQAARLALL